MEFNEKVLGYDAVVLENVEDGTFKYTVSMDLLDKIKEFHANNGLEFDVNEIREFEQDLDKNEFSFVGGYGYDVIDEELLCGTGDGIKKEQFQAYIDQERSKMEWIKDDGKDSLER